MLATSLFTALVLAAPSAAETAAAPAVPEVDPARPIGFERLASFDPESRFGLVASFQDEAERPPEDPAEAVELAVGGVDLSDLEPGEFDLDLAALEELAPTMIDEAEDASQAALPATSAPAIPVPAEDHARASAKVPGPASTPDHEDRFGRWAAGIADLVVGDVADSVAALLDGLEDDEPLPPGVMHPIAPEDPSVRALDLYPDNKTLVNPFGGGVRTACEGLMQWLAPRGNGSRWHSGIDLVPLRGRASGRKLFSPGDGFVLKRVDGHPQWGSYLIIAYRKGEAVYLTGWFHLRWGSHRHLQPRNRALGHTGAIKQGQLLGRVGSTGYARGAHLHLDAIRLRGVPTPANLPTTLWSGRDWSEFLHPADIISGLPRRVYRGRRRPRSGLMTRAVHAHAISGA